MNAITATKTDQYTCEFCQKNFRKESTLEAHLCEPKRRFREKDEMGVRLGLQAYLRFYEIAQGSSKLRSWKDFSESSYYRAFVKFGRHCQAIRAVNYAAFVDWLINNNVKIDTWCHDRVYQDYLVQHTRRESATDALARSIECSIEWAERTGASAQDYLRYGNTNTICHDVMRGRLTAWAIYNCTSGQEFLNRLLAEQITLIWSWIDSDVWQKKFRDYPADQLYVQEILKQAGW